MDRGSRTLIERVSSLVPDGGASKVFCLSMQRSGTTSFGDYLESCGLRRAGWPTSAANGWGRSWCEGRTVDVLTSPDFVSGEVFEDGPWWYPGAFEVVYSCLPRARFVLVERDPDAWFRSMCLHSRGRNPGHTRRHCAVYGRTDELDWMVEHLGVDPERDGQIDIAASAPHYKERYRAHGERCRAFFADKPGALHVGRLGDPELFAEIHRFLGIDGPVQPSVHANRSSRIDRARLRWYLRAARRR